MKNKEQINETPNKTEVKENQRNDEEKEQFLLQIAQNFDLNIYETKVWLALLNKGTLTATEISAYSGVPRSRTYDVLESLEKKGFVAMHPGRPIKYIALKPELVIERLKIKEMNDLREKLKLIDSLKESEFIMHLKSLYDSNQDIANITKLSENLNNFQVYERIRDMLKQAHKSIKIMLTVHELYRLLDNTGGTIYTALKKDLDIKIIAMGKPDRTLERFFGEEKMVYVDNLKMRMIIVDDSNTIFLINPQDMGLWTSSNFVSEQFSKWFDLIWNKQKERMSKKIVSQKEKLTNH